MRFDGRGVGLDGDGGFRLRTLVAAWVLDLGLSLQV